MLIRVIGEMEQPAIIIMTAIVTAILTAVAARYVKLVPGVHTHTHTQDLHRLIRSPKSYESLALDISTRHTTNRNRSTDLPLLKQPDHMFYAIAWDCID